MGFSITTVCYGPMQPFHLLLALLLLLAPLLPPLLLATLWPERRPIALGLDD